MKEPTITKIEQDTAQQNTGTKMIIATLLSGSLPVNIVPQGVWLMAEY